MEKPAQLYHGSARRITGPLQPVLLQSTEDHVHAAPVVFATENAAVASLFMFPGAEVLSSYGFEQGIAFICVWGTYEEFKDKDHGGCLYVLPSDTFEKVGKAYEWQSPVAVTPSDVICYDSVLDGIKQNGGRIYFVNDDHLFDLIRDHKDSRLEILKDVKPW